MECKLDKNLLQDLLEDTIDPVERIIVEEHLKVCNECRKELTGLKLLFWELGDKANYDVELPKELNTLKDSIIENVLGNVPKNIPGMVMDVQVNNLKAAGTFLEYVPGAKQSVKLIKDGARAAPTAIGKVSKGLFSGARKLLAR